MSTFALPHRKNWRAKCITVTEIEDNVHGYCSFSIHFPLAFFFSSKYAQEMQLICYLLFSSQRNAACSFWNPLLRCQTTSFQIWCPIFEWNVSTSVFLSAPSGTGKDLVFSHPWICRFVLFVPCEFAAKTAAIQGIGNTPTHCMIVVHTWKNFLFFFFLFFNSSNSYLHKEQGKECIWTQTIGESAWQSDDVFVAHSRCQQIDCALSNFKFGGGYKWYYDFLVSFLHPPPLHRLSDPGNKPKLCDFHAKMNGGNNQLRNDLDPQQMRPQFSILATQVKQPRLKRTNSRMDSEPETDDCLAWPICTGNLQTVVWFVGLGWISGFNTFMWAQSSCFLCRWSKTKRPRDWRTFWHLR